MQDPRPVLETTENRGSTVVGVRCTACGYAVAYRRLACPACGGVAERENFGPAGTVWSHTRVRIPVGDRVPPYDLVYVDLQDGPRILAHGPDLDDRNSVPAFAIGARVELRGLTPSGDPLVKAVA